MVIASLAAILCLSLVALNLASMALAGRRWLARQLLDKSALDKSNLDKSDLDEPALEGSALKKRALDEPPVSIVRPVCGLETFSAETLASSFYVDWPEYEVIFCVQRAQDPIVPLIQQVIAAHPAIAARLLIGDDLISQNPKLNNCVKGWTAARHDWIVLADSNVLMPRDYLRRLMAMRGEGVGLIVSMPLGVRPQGFFAEVECAMLNSFQARWQYAAEAIGLGFAQGKNMLWPRAVLERAGGVAALAAEIAEDAASTKVVRAQNLRVRLVDRPFAQPLGYRSAREVWSRHARWARLRRATFPGYFAPEILSGAVAPLFFGALAAHFAGMNVWATVGLTAFVLYGAEWLLAVRCGFFVNSRSLLAFILRDLCLPVMWLDACLFDDFTWRGNKMNVREASDEPAGEAG